MTETTLSFTRELAVSAHSFWRYWGRRPQSHGLFEGWGTAADQMVEVAETL